MSPRFPSPNLRPSITALASQERWLGTDNRDIGQRANLGLYPAGTGWVSIFSGTGKTLLATLNTEITFLTPLLCGSAQLQS